MNEPLEIGLVLYGVVAAYDYAIMLTHYKRMIKNIDECDLRTEPENKFLKRNVKALVFLPFPLDLIYDCMTRHRYNRIRDKYCVACKDVIEVRDDNNLENIVGLIKPTTN